MRTNPVSNYVHHDSTPTSPAHPSSPVQSDDEYLVSANPLDAHLGDLFFIPRVRFFQCQASEFEQRRAELATRGFVCYEPVIQGSTYNVTYMRVEGLRSIAMQMLGAGDTSTSEDLEGV